jgi:hypothetical protein
MTMNRHQELQKVITQIKEHQESDMPAVVSEKSEGEENDSDIEEVTQQ